MDIITRLLGLGFWPTIQGYLSSARVANAGRVIELAAGPRFGVDLPATDANRLIQLALDARAAARSWYLGNDVRTINVPVVPVPGSPMAGGIGVGKYDILLQVVGSPKYPASAGFVQFSSDCTGSVQDCIESLTELINQGQPGSWRGGPGSWSKFASDVDKIINDLLYNPRAAFVPLSLVQRLRGRQ